MLSVSSSPVRGGLQAYLPALFFVAASLLIVAVLGQSQVLPRISDDAYYYFVVARNVALHGYSEFTPGVPTNGYHPLWMLLLAATGWVFGFELATYRVLEILAVGVGLTAFVRLFDIRGLASAFFCTFVIWYVVRSFALNGMETSLLVPAFVLFAAACISGHGLVERHRAWLLFLSGAMCIGTRLDSALFVLPALCVAPAPLRAKARILAGLAACGALYAGINRLLFDAMLPVSGTIKSLGGLQWNDRYAAQVASGLDLKGLITLNSQAALYIAALVALAIAAWCGRTADADRRVLRFILAGVAGLLLSTIKLLFFSSWQVWAWYSYPLLWFTLPIVLLLDRRLGGVPAYRALALAIGVMLAGYFLYNNVRPRSADFAEINQEFLARHAALLDGAPVAMGDRAGSFAYHYDGGVYQLEGLVNDAAYLKILSGGGDLRPHLCARGISYLLDYEPPLPDYATHRIEILRPRLTTFRGPYIDVRRDEEIAYHDNLSRYDNRDYDEGDYRLHLWRLDCETARSTGVMTSPLK